jgi:4-hydroxybenzoate polyprenyltransferase
MDRTLDVEQNIRSIPARFGVQTGHTLPIALHLLTALLLLILGFLTHPHPLYYLGVFFACVLTRYEYHSLKMMKDVFALNERVFHANMIFSATFLATTILGFALR